MSEAELHILAGRLQESKRAAARRGELRFPLPIGYVYDDDGRTVRRWPDPQRPLTPAWLRDVDPANRLRSILLLFELLRQFAKALFARHACRVPDRLHVSVGFPSVGALRRRSPSVGECWPAQTSQDGCAHLFISPVLHDPTAVLGVLVHELIHAAVGAEARHGPRFRRPALAIGLRGRMTATVPGSRLTAQLEALGADLGPFPHAAIVADPARRKQTTRLLKIECLACGYTARVTARWIARGLPTCPCGAQMDLSAS
jgi:hypothetical protein